MLVKSSRGANGLSPVDSPPSRAVPKPKAEANRRSARRSAPNGDPRQRVRGDVLIFLPTIPPIKKKRKPPSQRRGENAGKRRGIAVETEGRRRGADERTVCYATNLSRTRGRTMLKAQGGRAEAKSPRPKASRTAARTQLDGPPRADGGSPRLRLVRRLCKGCVPKVAAPDQKDPYKHHPQGGSATEGRAKRSRSKSERSLKIAIIGTGQPRRPTIAFRFPGSKSGTSTVIAATVTLTSRKCVREVT